MTVFRRIALALAIVVAGLASAPAQNTQASYPKMAPLDQYLIADRNAEIALARTAAPRSISDNAEVMVLGKDGYEVAVQGTNHFVCFVERSWDAAIGDPVFWNPKIRGPNCVNAAAARSWLPIALMKTRLAVSGQSQQKIDQAMQAAFRSKKLPELEPGSMCYMMSKQGYLNDAARNWHPHLMFFVPLAMSKTWGANLSGSPVFSGDDVSDHLTIFMIPVAHWSDGTPDTGGTK
ncbi:MAG TPA: hypothetical protein VHE33_13745 [Acidobacteriaceae bacterium]|nr:hypothetical protein [Acidobacteriaceae bacterium]